MPRPGRWVVGASVRGPVHVRDGRPNQDARAWSDADPSGGPLVVALSDGHGGRRSSRSDVGARLAVDIAVDVGRQLTGPEGREAVAAVVDRWAASVHAHLAASPLSDEERDAVAGDPLLAYGATLLVAVVFEREALLMQVGDGEMLLARPSAPVVRPLPPDPRLFANETTSLCMPDAAAEFRCTTVQLNGDELSVLLLATDGLSNAYPDEQGLLQVGADLAGRIAKQGEDGVQADLDGLVGEASAHSGDDVTVAVVVMDGRTAR